MLCLFIRGIATSEGLQDFERLFGVFETWWSKKPFQKFKWRDMHTIFGFKEVQRGEIISLVRDISAECL